MLEFRTLRRLPPRFFQWAALVLFLIVVITFAFWWFASWEIHLEYDAVVYDRNVTQIQYKTTVRIDGTFYRHHISRSQANVLDGRIVIDGIDYTETGSMICYFLDGENPLVTDDTMRANLTYSRMTQNADGSFTGGLDTCGLLVTKDPARFDTLAILLVSGKELSGLPTLSNGRILAAPALTREEAEAIADELLQ